MQPRARKDARPKEDRGMPEHSAPSWMTMEFSHFEPKKN